MERKKNKTRMKGPRNTDPLGGMISVSATCKCFLKGSARSDGGKGHGIKLIGSEGERGVCEGVCIFVLHIPVSTVRGMMLV